MKVAKLFQNGKTYLTIIFQVFIKPWPGFILYLLIIGFISGLIPVLQIKAITELVNTLTVNQINSGSGNQESIFTILEPYLSWLFIFTCAFLVDLIVQSRTFLTYIGTILEEQIRRQFFHRFLQKALSLRLELFESTAYYDQVEHIREIFRSDLTQPLLELQRFVATGTVMFVILWQLAQVHWIIPLIVIPGTISIARLRVHLGQLWWVMNFKQTSVRRRSAYWRTLLIERDPSAETRLFDLKDHIITQWRKLSTQRLVEFSQTAQHHLRHQLPLIILLTGLGGAAYLILLVAALNGPMSVGLFAALLYIFMQYEMNIDPLGQRLEAFSKLVLDMRSLIIFLDLEGEELQVAPEAPTMVEGVRFESVNFRYPGSQQLALEAINLHIHPGEKIALVGENGSGKSTIAKLLLGLYQPTEGCIYVDGVSLQNILPASWRLQTSAVMQDFMRYAFTARENIGIGNIDKLSDDIAIKHAAVASNASVLIEKLPYQYETRLGKEFKDGQDLSTGQWQKLAIARAYIRNAAILVLDEPTSALDPLAELEIYRHFLELTTNKTVLLISHRLRSVQLADHILFLEKGRIIESGTHEELMTLNGAYATLYSLQVKGDSTLNEKEGISYE